MLIKYTTYIFFRILHLDPMGVKSCNLRGNISDVYIIIELVSINL
jgi:hypothetical protein